MDSKHIPGFIILWDLLIPWYMGRGRKQRKDNWQFTAEDHIQFFNCQASDAAQYEDHLILSIKIESVVIIYR